MFAGMKTYIAAGIAIVVAVLSLFSGALSITEAAQAIGLALGTFGIRFRVAEIEALLGAAKLDTLRSSRIVAIVTPYLSAIITVLASLSAWLTGEQGSFTAMLVAVGALIMAFLGMGVGKAEKVAIATS